MLEKLKTLQAKYPWPSEKPALAFNDQGWFPQCNREMLSRFVSRDTKLIVELGAWLGLSTRWLLDHALNAKVITIDHWKGDAATANEPVLPVLYETFVSNCWTYQDRLIAMRTTTLEGMDELMGLGLKPDLIYVDAAHDYDSAVQDIKKATNFGCVMIGDDFNPNAWIGVVKAVWEESINECRDLAVHGNAWCMTLPEKSNA